MQRINLSQNKVALLDDEDHARLAQFRWHYRAERNGGLGYAVRHAKDGKKYRTVYLHRDVIGTVPPGHEVIFRNGDRLDCRRENLAVVTQKEARQHHRKARSNSKTGIKGITYNRGPNTWSVDIYRDGQTWRIGTYLKKEYALQAHQEALMRENPDLHSAPAVVERKVEEGSRG